MIFSSNTDIFYWDTKYWKTTNLFFFLKIFNIYIFNIQFNYKFKNIIDYRLICLCYNTSQKKLIQFKYKNIYNFIFLFNNNFNNLLNLNYLNYFYKISNITNNLLVSNYNISNYDFNLYFLKLFIKKNIDKYLTNNNNLITINKKIILFRTSFLDIVLKKYIEYFLNSKVFINFDKYNIKFFKKKKKLINFFKKKLKRIHRILKKTKITLKAFIFITVIFLFSKDINLYYRILTLIIQQTHFKNHKRFLYYLKIFITKTLLKFYKLTNFTGFYFFISGKISCSGNSKTRKYIISYGKHSFTNKMLKLNIKKGLIYTKTGVLGFKFFISYN
uniref:Ymf64 n=1 Tax=Ichthyophthirius multifiliis TaxID=5932 RepID=G1FLC2_ICHMU|nr:Ymf64 [Ichthyophthirius multifiliis]AEL89264.1 Ymf64 [Ichthyophthirius multifiliis]